MEQLIVNEETREISFGGKTWISYTYFKNPKWALSQGLWDEAFKKINETEEGKNKEYYKAFHKVFGCTLKAFCKFFNGAMNRVWIKPVYPLVMQYAWAPRGKSISGYNVTKIWNAIDKIRQAESDGLHHLVPWIIKFEKDPKQLKEMFGERVWKQLCKNSKTRNKLLADQTNVDNIVINGRKELILSRYHGSIEAAIKVPSKYLRWGNLVEFDEAFIWIMENKPQAIDKKVNGHALRHLFWDTRQQADELGERFNPEWSIRKMKEKHQEFSRRILEKDFSAERFKWLEGRNLPTTFAYAGGYTATLLQSPFEVAEEGSAMRHCVASYISWCQKGRYLVYSIRKGEERSSTLGIDQSVSARVWEIQQHYGQCNKRVESWEELMLAKALVEEINLRLRMRKGVECLTQLLAPPQALPAPNWLPEIRE